MIKQTAEKMILELMLKMKKDGAQFEPEWEKNLINSIRNNLLRDKHDK